MIVYRLCKKEEIAILFCDKSFQNIGKVCEINSEINTHFYEPEKKYIHFFKNKGDIFYLDVKQDMFICTYDVPSYLLQRYSGIGFYYDRYNFRNLEHVTEYAIENEYIDFNYLIKIEKILEFIDIDDYMYDDISSKIDTIYLNPDIINKISNKCNCDSIYNLYNVLMDNDIKQSINSNLNYLIKLIPEIKSMIGFEHKHPHHHLDVWKHTLEALSISDKDFDVRLSLLLHDIGKPFTCTETDGVRHFYNHPYVSSEMSKSILTRLGFNNEYINKICYLIKMHDTPIKEREIDNSNYELIFTRFLIQKSDALAHNPDKLDKRKKNLDATKKLLLK